MSASPSNSRMVAIASTIAFFIITPKLFRDLWPDRIDDVNLFVFLYPIIIHEILYFSVNAVYFVLYRFEFKFFEQYRLNKEDWPWKTNKQEFIAQLIRSAEIILFNQLAIIPILSYINIYLAKSNKLRIDSESFPSILEIVWQCLFCMILEDFAFYWSHRFLHWKPLYPYIHKVHHEFKYTLSFASEHAHFIEFIFGNIIPTNLGIRLLGSKCHAATMGIWIIIRVIKTCDAHSGYHFPWSPFTFSPFLIIPSEFHNFHHMKFKHNYGSFFTFWDKVSGTLHPAYRNFDINKKYE